MEQEGSLRLAAFVATAVVLAIWERLLPRRGPEPGRIRRWGGNLGIATVSTLVVRSVFPVLPVGMALLAGSRGAGLLPVLGLPAWGEVVAGLLLLDMAVYFQHRTFHAWRLLWRLHRVHHADTFFDFTTGVRFHPLEITLSMGFKLALVALLGPPPLAVLLFEIMLNCVSMFNHANGWMPEKADGLLRLLVVTPDMHRGHHSTDMREANRNFGFNFSWWDRLFATYQREPALGHERMAIGLGIFREPKHRSLLRMLAMPFL